MIPQDLLLVKILKLIIEVVPPIEMPKKAGRPFIYSPKVIICCLLVMAAKRLTVRGLYAFLNNQDSYQAVVIKAVIPFPKRNIPNRRTFDRRFKTSLLSIQLYMLSVVNTLVKKFKLAVARLSLDNRMFKAFGSIWHRKDQKQGLIPDRLRNVDTTAGWGVSVYRGWIFGHALDVIVTTGKLIIPIMATARSLTIRGNTAVRSMTNLLPKVKKGVISADCEYHDQKLNSLFQQTGRSLHSPTKQKPELTPKSITYQKRKTTVEPFFEKFLQAFVFRDKLDRKGPQAWPYLTACCLLYQLMVLYNLISGKPNPLEVTHLIRIL